MNSINLLIRLLTCLVITGILLPSSPSASAQCPAEIGIEILDLRGVNGFPQTDSMIVCGVADTVAILLYTDDPGNFNSIQLDLNISQGMEYAGFFGSHFENGPSVSALNTSDGSNPSFTISGLNNDSLAVIYFGIKANCAATPEVFGMEIEFLSSYAYIDEAGAVYSCEDSYTPEAEYSSEIKIPVLNILSVEPDNLSITEIDQTSCQNITISQDGLKASINRMDFIIENIDLENLNLEGLYANGSTLNYTYDASSMTLSAPINDSYFYENEIFDGTSSDEYFDEDEQLNIEVCFSLNDCPQGDNTFLLDYEVSYGCGGDVCRDPARKGGSVSFRPNFISNPVSISSVTQQGEFCGDALIYEFELSSTNEDQAEGLWQDLMIKWEACQSSNTQIANISVSGQVLPDSTWFILDGLLNLDFTKLDFDPDGPGGITNTDLDNRFDDLPGGNTLLIEVEVEIVCANGGNCQSNNCEISALELTGIWNCGENFSEISSIDPPINFFYGEESYMTNDTIYWDSRGQYLTEFISTSPETWTASDNGFSLSTDFGYENIAPCNGESVYFVVNVSANTESRNRAIRYQEGSATYEGNPIQGVTWNYEVAGDDTLGLQIQFPATNAQVDISDYYYNLEFYGFCAPDDYLYTNLEIIEPCNCGEAQECEIVRACHNMLSWVRWNGTDCDCNIYAYVDTLYRCNFGYTDKTMTQKVDPATLPTADLQRFLPGDTMYVRLAYEIINSEILHNSNNQWSFGAWHRDVFAPGMLDVTQASFEGWFLNQTENGDITEMGVPSCFNDYPASTRDNYFYPSMRLGNFGVDGHDKTAQGQSEGSYTTCTDDPNINSDYPAEVVSYDYYAASDDYRDGYFQLDIYWNRPENCPYAPSYFTDEDGSDDHVNDCQKDFLFEFPIADGDIIYIDLKVPVVSNPYYHPSSSKWKTNYFYPYASSTTVLESNCKTVKLGTSCNTSYPFEVHNPGDVIAEPEIYMEDCEITVSYNFTLENPTPIVTDGQTPWYENEYRPITAVEALIPTYPNNLVYLGEANITDPLDNTIALSDQYVYDQEAFIDLINNPAALPYIEMINNQECIQGDEAICCVSNNPESSAKLLIMDQAYLDGLEIPIWQIPIVGDDDLRQSGDLCDIMPLINKGMDPFPILAVGGANDCDWSFEYKLSAQCIKEVNYNDFMLTAQFANTYVPNYNSSVWVKTDSVNSSGGSQGISSYWNIENYESYVDPYSPMDSINENYLGLQYWPLTPDPFYSRSNPARQNLTVFTNPDNFIDASNNYPPLVSEIDQQLIAAIDDGPETVQYTICAEEVPNTEIHENMVSSIYIPSNIALTGIYDIDGNAMDFNLLISEFESNVYSVPLPNLGPGACFTYQIETDMLFCIESIAANTICVNTLSGCLLNDKLIELNAASEACNDAEACYRYIQEDTGLQGEWFIEPPQAQNNLCDTLEMAFRLKNVKESDLLNLAITMFIPHNGLELVPGSWEFAHPGGPTTVDSWISIPDPIANPDLSSPLGEAYTYDNPSVYSQDIFQNGLEGISNANTTEDKNKIAFKFKVLTVCEEFVAGSPLRFISTAADGCGGNVSSGLIESVQLFINNIDSDNQAEFLITDVNTELYCGVSNQTINFSALNLSEFASEGETEVCLTLPDGIVYTDLSLNFTSPSEFEPAFVNSSNENGAFRLCFQAPSNIPSGGMMAFNILTNLSGTVTCGEELLDVEIKNYIENNLCSTSNDSCGVYNNTVSNSLQTVSYIPTLNGADLNFVTVCDGDPDIETYNYTLTLNNEGQIYNQKVNLFLIGDLNNNGIADPFEPILDNDSETILLFSGESTEISGEFVIPNSFACSTVLTVDFGLECGCDELNYLLSEVAPDFLEPLPENILTSCEGIPAILDVCEDYKYILDPQDESAGTLTVENGELSFDFNTGENGPVTVYISSLTSSCDQVYELEIYSTDGFDPPAMMNKIVCADGCSQLNLNIPNFILESAEILWTPGSSLDDPTSSSPEICEPTSNMTYNVNIDLGNGCAYDIPYNVQVDLVGEITATVSEHDCYDPNYPPYINIMEGFDIYDIYLIINGNETLMSSINTNIFAPSMSGTYFAKGRNIGDNCSAISNTVEVLGILCEHDLALTKTIKSQSSTPLYPGSEITYSLNVYNQGNSSLTNIVITDFVPEGLIFSPNNSEDWTDSNGDTYLDYTIEGPILPEDSISIDINFQIDSTINIQTKVINSAEILSFRDGLGNDQTSHDIDSSPDNNPDNDGGGNALGSSNDAINGDGSSSESGSDSPATDEDDQDTECSFVEIFDLALRKELAPNQNSTFDIGETVQFEITVFNQGSVAAQNISLVDYIPSGLELADSNWDIDVDGYAIHTINSTINPESELSVFISFIVTQYIANGIIDNFIEISSAEDNMSNQADDIDSTPNSNPNDDGAYEDNEIFNENEDEDDHDIESIQINEPTVPSIDIEKLTNGNQADDINDSDVPTILEGNTVTWIYMVTNTGETDLINLTVNDDIEGLVCEIDFLAMGQTTICSLQGSAQIGEYENTADVVGFPVDEEGNLTDDEPVSDEDISHYIGEEIPVDPDPVFTPSIDIEKLTNGNQADDINDSDVPTILEGNTVTWTYLVTNTGETDLINLTVTDDIEGLVCEIDFLAKGQSTICSLQGIAQIGEYENTADVVGFPVDEDGNLTDDEPVSDEDISHYIGEEIPVDPDPVFTPSIDIEKLTNGNQADDINDSDVPTILEGNTVTWTYLVTNTGETDLINLTVSDDIEGLVCEIDFLAMGQTTICSLQGSAQIGEYENTADVIGFPVDEDGNPTGDNPVSDQDISHYIGEEIPVDPDPVFTPSIDIEKLTNGNQADDINDSDVPTILEGNAVTWTYIITNTGERDLIDLVVNDNVEGLVCEIGYLAIGQSTLCSINGTAQNESYENIADVIGFPVDSEGNLTGDIPVTDSDPSHYIGIDVPTEPFPVYTPSISVEKLTNGFQADDANGPDVPLIEEGAEVTWTYIVSNNGETEISNISVNDNMEGFICEIDFLAIGETSTCTKTGTATDGMYQNMATVTGYPFDPNGGPSNAPISDNDLSHYIGYTVEIFDLALIKQLAAGQSNEVMPGDTVVYSITVINQGNQVTDNIIILDYLPEGSLLADDNWIANLGNAQIVLSVENGTLPPAGLVPGATITMDISVKLSDDLSSDESLANFAEIAGLTDINGNDVGDHDSTPDGINDDNYFIDDEPNGNGNAGGDEDDHDGEIVEVPFCDLALIKTLSNDQEYEVNVGEEVQYIISVFNQGNTTVSNIEVIDYLPEGLSLVSSDWEMDGDNAVVSISFENGFAPDENITIPITCLVNEGAAGLISNYAEISSVIHPNGNIIGDVDSNPDSFNNDLLFNDNDITSNGINGGDEDDHDLEDIFVVPPTDPGPEPEPDPIIDLELTKTINTDTIFIGDQVEYTLTINNISNEAEGLTFDATAVQVTDILPYGTIFLDYESSIGLYNSGTGVWNVGDLDNGGTEVLVITAMVVETGVIVNEAEVSQAGEPDIDSTPANNVPTEDDQANVPLYSTDDLCDNPVECEFVALCVQPGDQLLICPNWCYEGEFEIITNTSSNNGYVEVLSDGCFMYIPLTAAIEAGKDEVTIEAMGVGNNVCLSITYDLTIGGCDPEEPIDLIPSIDIEKLTNGNQADQLTDGDVPSILEGEEVTWTYIVTNNGATDLIDITVMDDVEGLVCEIGFLSAGSSTTCTLQGTAMSGVYTNIADVVGTAVDENGDPTDDEPVTDMDPSHYIGELLPVEAPTPSVDIEKLTNGNQADQLTDDDIPSILEGEEVTWTYIVTNNGETDLIDIVVMDDVEGLVCEIGFLSVGSSTTCTLQGIAIPIVYSNVANVTATPVDEDGEPIGIEPVSDMDVSHYIGEILPIEALTPSIDIEKLTNGNQADQLTDDDLPTILEGTEITWTYIVTNNGETDLIDITVMDDIEGLVCEIDFLEMGESTTCTMQGIAIPIVYSNVANVIATPADENGDPTGDAPVSDSDSSNYVGEENPTEPEPVYWPSIDLEKLTNGNQAEVITDADVPVLDEGDLVTWTYIVSNNGDRDLINVIITDDVEGMVCEIDFLAIGESNICTLQGIARAGNYSNIGEVIAIPVDEEGHPTAEDPVTDSDPSNYIGEEIPVIDPPSCEAEAGELIPINETVCEGEYLGAYISEYPYSPAGFLVNYLLVKDGEILEAAILPNFNSNEIGDYEIYMLVFDPGSINPASIGDLSSLNDLLNSAEICGSLSTNPANIYVQNCQIDCDQADQEQCVEPYADNQDPHEICIDFCSEGMVIQDMSSTFSCGLNANGNHCFTFLPLPGFIGENIIEVNACNDSGQCETASITITVSPYCDGIPEPETCDAEAGSLTAVYDEICAGQICGAVINEYPNSPSGFNVRYLLVSNGSILETSNVPNFGALAIGSYGIHSLVYNPADFNPNDYTNLNAINQILIQGGGNYCGSLLMNPAIINIVDCTNECDGADQNICVAPFYEDQNGHVICLDYCAEGMEIQDIQSIFACGTNTLGGACFKFTPLPSFEGENILEVTACNAQGVCETATVTILVSSNCDGIEPEPENENPNAVTDNVTTPENTAITINALNNDSDPDGDNIYFCNAVGDLNPLNGTLTLTGSGFIYTPNQGFSGQDSFTYTICDGNGGSDQTTVYITVEAAAVNCNTDETLCVAPFLSNQTSTLVCVDFCGSGMNINNLDSDFNCGLEIGDNNCFHYTPLPLFAGVNHIMVEGCNAQGQCETVNVYITVSENCGNQPPINTNNPPTAINDYVDTEMNTSISINAMSNDGDPDGDSLSFCGHGNPNNGTIGISGNGFIYTPNSGFHGSDSFTYNVCDEEGLSSSATVYITVDGPDFEGFEITAIDDQVNTTCGDDIFIEVLDNDYNPAGTMLYLCGFGNPSNGYLIQSGYGFIYTPNGDFTGTDSFSYTACSDGLTEDEAMVYINVSCQGNPGSEIPNNGNPTGVNAIDDQTTTPDNSSVYIEVLNNDSYDSNCTPIVEVLNSASISGNVLISGGTIIYIPQLGSQGLVYIDYEICCGTDCDQATVQVEVYPHGACSVDGFRVPNIFSPNGDGVNEQFSILEDQSVFIDDAQFKLSIFDTNGSLVYRNEAYKKGDVWDGTFFGEGNPLSEGTYFYQFEIIENETASFKQGFVELRR